MGRVHIFEWSNQSWVPGAWRGYVTDYLRFMVTHGPFEALPALVARVVPEAGGDIVDLCSGSGGPWPAYLEEPRSEFEGVTVRLTDLHPNVEAFERLERESEGRIEGVRESVDATDVPEGLSGPRVIINGFHNFRPEEAREILADAVEDGVTIGVYEVMDRRAVTLLPLVLVPLFVLVLTPFVRPFRWGRLFWTYVVPVVPLMVMWDGIVSALRTYSPEELREMTEEFEEYEWEIDRVAAGERGPGRVTYLVGRGTAVVE
jgi:hypothetical protein